MRQLLPAIIVSIIAIACNNNKADKQAAPITLTSNGTKIAYNSCGNGDTTLLFVHGWAINKEYWEPQLKHFCPHYKVVAIDLPGFGQSGKDRSNWEFDNYTDDIKNIIDSLRLKNVILIGHSMSGDIVLNVSNKYPASVIGIVGIDNLHQPSGPPNEKQALENEQFFQQLSLHFDSLVGGYMRPGLFLPGTDTALVERVMNDVAITDSTIAAAVLISNTKATYKEQERMQHLQHKLYLINTDMYPVSMDSLTKYCTKGAQAEVLHAKSHYPMIEVPDAFNAALRKVIYAIGNK
jgi:pimeloyl-ACP methyl ester carboxylesterase